VGSGGSGGICATLSVVAGSMDVANKSRYSAGK